VPLRASRTPKKRVGSVNAGFRYAPFSGSGYTGLQRFARRPHSRESLASVALDCRIWKKNGQAESITKHAGERFFFLVFFGGGGGGGGGGVFFFLFGVAGLCQPANKIDKVFAL